MVNQFAARRRMEKFIGYDAYNNTERYQKKIKRQTPVLNEENSIPIGCFIIDMKTKEEKFIRYVEDKSGNIINPETKKIIRKAIDNKFEKADSE